MRHTFLFFATLTAALLANPEGALAQESISQPGTGTTYSNPVIRRDCPDPTVLDDRANTGYFYAYSTQSAKTGLMNRDNSSKEAAEIINLPIYRSKNLIDWEFAADGFAAGRPVWLDKSSIWAP
ncbi:MAG: family 43 glycosylhydrolase, partial [Bacteroidales bacterium]|nr:family 43 glycosylhydrolase [Bacteroidales bacterium]